MFGTFNSIDYKYINEIILFRPFSQLCIDTVLCFALPHSSSFCIMFEGVPFSLLPVEKDDMKWELDVKTLINSKIHSHLPCYCTQLLVVCKMILLCTNCSPRST